MTEGKVGLGGIVLDDEPVMVHKSLEACNKLLNVLICLVKAGGVVDELELISTDGVRGGS